MADKFLKRLELNFKKKLEYFINGNIPPLVFNNSQIIDPKKIRKIILLRQDRLGDLLISSSFLRNLKEINKDFQIDILLSTKNIGGIRCIEKYINNVFVYNKKISSIINIAQQINKNNYDLVIDLFDNASTTSSLFLKFIKGPIKIGFDKKNRNSYDIVISLPDKMQYHIVDRLAEFFKIFGINPNSLNKDLEYPINQSCLKQEMIQISINISGSNRSKFWGVENNIKLIQLINSDYPHFKVVLFGTKDYTDELNEISNKTNSMIAPFTNSVDEWANKLSESSIIITPDTSAVHLAASWKIPCLVFYETNDFAIPWTPYNSPFEMLTTKDKPIQSISPKNAYIGLKKLIEKIQ